MSSLYREGASSAFWRTHFLLEDTGVEQASLLYEAVEDDAAIKLLDLRQASNYTSYVPQADISLFAHGNPVRITELLAAHCLHLPRPTGGVVCRELREYLAGHSREGIDLTWAQNADRYIASGLIDDVFPALTHEVGEREGVRGNVFLPYDMEATSARQRQAVFAWLPPFWYHAWDFFFTDRPLDPVRRSSEVSYLGQGAVPEVIDLLKQANPETEAFEHIETRHWYGIKGDDSVLCAVSTDEQPLVGLARHCHLAGLATHPQARGQGLAGAVMVGATNTAMAKGADLVTFGMWGGNHVARRLYARIGYINGGRQYMLGKQIEESPSFSATTTENVNEQEKVPTHKLGGGEA